MARLAASARQLLRKLQRDRKGSISLLAGISLTAVVGFAGLGTEAAYWYVKERTIQSATDSAAIAAAAATMASDSTNAITAATTMTAQYGFSVGAVGVGGCTDTTQATILCIHNPPSAGNYQGNSNAWEVIVSQTQPRLFSALFMNSDPVMSARAVAAQVPTAPSCVVTLDTTKLFPDLQDNGSANVSMPGCNVFVDSCDPNGALTVGGTGSYLAKGSFACGNIVKSGSGTLTDTVTTDKNTGATYPNPYGNKTFANLFGSDSPPCQYNNVVLNNGSGTQALTPGVYCGGLAIDGGTVTMTPGNYIINGTGQASATGLSINGGTVSCPTCGPNDGVTFALTGSGSSPTTWAQVSINGNANINLQAPTPLSTVSGAAPPFLFYQNEKTPTSAIQNQFNGSATDNFQGAFYFPNQQVRWNGNSNEAQGKCVQLVVYQVVFNGTTNFSSNTATCNGLGIVSLQEPGGIAIALVE